MLTHPSVTIAINKIDFFIFRAFYNFDAKVQPFVHEIKEENG